jgi:predicted AAA+ superfamily ATPase
MAHDRVRSVKSLYDKIIKASPILGIFGHRQVGKTTFINHVTENYITFDSKADKKRAEEDPEKFILSLKKHPFGIDECQMVPDLFPALKEQVRKKKQPGQFILSGSVRFTSRKAIRESLAGRMMFFELYPLIISELDQRPLPDFFIEVLNRKTLATDFFEKISEKEFVKREKTIDLYLSKGGLPGICFLREDRLMRERLDDLLRLMLDRDLRMVYETKLSLEVLMSFLKIIASFGWQGYSYTRVKEELGMSPVTQKAILFALESIFMIRRIPIGGGSKGEIILLEDQFEEIALSDHLLSKDDQLNSLVYRNLRAQFQYRLGIPFAVSSYWTKNNARVPLVIKSSDQVLGVICIDQEEPSLSQLRAADSLLKAESNSKVLILSKKLRQAEVINSRVAIVPMVFSI